jgi:hypothetical protein
MLRTVLELWINVPPSVLRLYTTARVNDLLCSLLFFSSAAIFRIAAISSSYRRTMSAMSWGRDSTDGDSSGGWRGATAAGTFLPLPLIPPVLLEGAARRLAVPPLGVD